MQTPPDSTSTPSSTQEPFSLAPLLSTLWSYRRPASAAMLAVMVLYAIFALSATLRSPVERVASVGFRALFDGADRGEYPNGAPFLAGDIIAPAILAVVHGNNDLGRYLTIEELSSGLSVTQSSPELTILVRSYEGRLADPTLSPVVRTELEREFNDRRAALRLPDMSLQLVQTTYATAMPDALTQKVLLDILETWESFSRDRGGVQRYAIEVLREETALRTARNQPAAVRLDMVRRLTERLIQQASILAQIPGVNTVTTADGTTSGDLASRLDELRGFDLQVSLARALRNAVGDEATTGQLYLRARMREAERRRDEQQAAVDRYESALRLFSADGVPATPAGANIERAPGQTDSQVLQLPDSFMAELLAMARRQEDFDYRRALAGQIFEFNQLVARHHSEYEFYRGLLDDIAQGGLRGAPVPAAAVEAIESELREIMTRQNELYTQISALNLDRGGLYRIVVGFSAETERGVIVSRLVFGGLSVLLLSLILIPLACLAHYTFWVRRRQDGSVA